MIFRLRLAGKTFVSTLFAIFLLSACKKDPDKVVAPEPVLSSDKVMKTFVFRSAKNSVFLKDVVGEIIGDTIYTRAFSASNLSYLVPEFTFEGAKVMVDDKEQKSSATDNNFTKPVTYRVVAEDKSEKKYVVKFSDSGIAALYISTDGKPITSKEVYVNGTIRLVSNFTEVVFDGKMDIKGRGNSTWYDMPKKPYKIKLDKKAPLLGMPENKSWVLLANYADKTLMRNEMAFILSRSIGREFTTQSRYVEVFLNGNYEGNYQLAQQVKEGKGQVDVEDGGYLIEQDLFANGEPTYFYTGKGMPFVIKYPDDDKVTKAQKDYISAHFQKAEDALFSVTFADPVNGYRKYIDVDTYVDYYIINEVIGNPDVFRSTYMFKKKGDDKIYTGPVWDFDKAANNDNRPGDQTSGLMLDAAFEPKLWVRRMMEDQTFRQRIRSRWNELKPKIKALSANIDPLAKKLAVSQAVNFKRWDIIGRQSYIEVYVWPTYEAEVAYLKKFLDTHITWLDTKFNSATYQ